MEEPAPAQILGSPADRSDRLLDSAVLERYLLLLSLDVEVQRIRAEQQQAMARIDADLALANAASNAAVARREP